MNGSNVTAVEREVSLRNGTRGDVGLVSAVMDFLEGLADHHPNYFRVLLALTRDEKPIRDFTVTAELRAAGALATDGSLRPLFRDVLQSAVRETPEGVVLVSPFAPRDETEVGLVRGHVSAYEERMARFARKLGYTRPTDDGGPLR